MELDLDRSLAALIISPRHPTFTADDLTVSGVLTIDPTHTPNSRQSAIGSAFRIWANRGLIEQTGQIARSRSPHRKGGAQRIWRATDKGKVWADTWIRTNRLLSSSPPPSSRTTNSPTQPELWRGEP